MAISLGVAIVLGLCSSGGSRAAVAETSPQIVAKQILEATGAHGGLVIHLGCGAGQLTAALRTSDNIVVQGLDASPANVEKARAAIQSSGLYGPVSVNLFEGKRLPYVDNLANLIVVEDPGQVPMAEIMRVLAPLGVACVKQGGAWTKTVKPWPTDIDEWPQHLYGGDNNAVAHDRVVGPPRHYQWTSTPEWSRAHLVLPSIQGLISARGRLFTIEDQASVEHPALPGEFTLVARDAFNGIVLWQRRFPDWHPMNLYIKHLTAQIMRRVAAIGDTVYCTPGYSAPITAFDAATGKQLKIYAGTDRTQELVYDQGVLFAVIGDHVDTRAIGDTKGSLAESQFPQAAYGPIIPKLDDPKSTIVALDAGSGRRLWEKSGADTAGYQGSSLAVRGQYVAFCSAKPGPGAGIAKRKDKDLTKRGTEGSVVCLDRTSGAVLWRKPVPLALSSVTGTVPALVLSDSAVYVADAKALHAFSIKDGAQLWTGNAQINHHKAPDLFLTGGVIWTGYGGKYTAYDPATGKVVKTIEQAMTGPMGHDRCYRNRITDRFYIDSATGGSDFVSLDTSGGTSQSEFPNPWVRSTCGIGFLPCNGLLYAGPPACACSNGVMLNALNALAPEPGMKSSNQPIEIATIPRLEKGPAYKEISDSKSRIPDSSDWPTYRHDAGRSGHTTAAGPAQLQPLWTVKLCTSTGSHPGGVREGVRISAPVIAASKVFVADVDAHAVCALDADTGRVAWRFTAGARIDSPPTYYQGWLLFGSRDGWVYCLRAADGALAWRFKDLPDDRWIMAYDQPESAWPVCGSVLTLNGVVYFAAGRNSFLDGGIWIYGLDPATGRVIHRRHMYGPYGDDGFPIIKGADYVGHGIQGFKNDVLLTDGKYLYLRHQPFNPDLSSLSANQSPLPHLIANPGFLESIPQHRSFWTINSALLYDIPTGSTAVHGDILAMDGSKYYEVRGYTPGRTNNFDPRDKGYTLYAGQFSEPTAAPTAAEGKSQSVTAPPTGRKAKKAARATGATTETAKKKTAGSPQASERWSANIPLTGKAIALAGDQLFVAGTPVAFPKDDLAAAYEGRMGGVLWVASADSGRKLAEIKLDAPPSWDGMAVAHGRLFVVLQDGSLRCFAAK
jgi:outer membrane protein assembly factor BamB